VRCGHVGVSQRFIQEPCVCTPSHKMHRCIVDQLAINWLSIWKDRWLV